MMNKKNIFKLIIILTVAILVYSCFYKRNRNNIIAIYYQAGLKYQNNEIKKKLNELSFRNNIKLYFVSSTNKNYIDKLLKNNPSTIIFEENNFDRVKRIYQKFHHSSKLVLITSKITNQEYCDYYFSTDFEILGQELAENLFEYSRRKRSLFLIFRQKEYAFNKEMLIKGVSSFLIGKGNISLYTNYYYEENQFDTVKFKRLLYSFTDGIRGIIVDDDSYGIKIAKELRRLGMDDEIKVASFGSILEGIDAVLKGEVIANADIDRFMLFKESFKIAVGMRNEKKFDNKRLIYYDKGICYTRANIVDKMALSKKYSIREILSSGHK